MTSQPPNQPHPLCRLLRELRRASGMSLDVIGRKNNISPVVLGAYERGDRTPPLNKLEYALSIYGYTLQAVPIGTQHTRLTGDVVADLRAIADQIEERDALLTVP